MRCDGSSRIASAGLPAWIAASVEGVRAGRPECLAGAGDRKLGVLGPQAQPIAGGPEPVQHQHADRSSDEVCEQPSRADRHAARPHAADQVTPYFDHPVVWGPG